jgi:hypothetical protein
MELSTSPNGPQRIPYIPYGMHGSKGVNTGSKSPNLNTGAAAAFGALVKSQGIGAGHRELSQAPRKRPGLLGPAYANPRRLAAKNGKGELRAALKRVSPDIEYLS